MHIRFSPPRIDDKTIAAVTEALRSGWITTGPRVLQFESELQRYTGSARVKCLNSATAGMELALRWFGVGAGDEVIIPAYTFAATGHVILHVGAQPVMVDVCAPDFIMDPDLVVQAITPKTKAIIPVDFGGMPCRYAELWEVIQDARTFIPSSSTQEKLGRMLMVTDAAHSLGALYDGKASALQADFTAFSFHAVKNLTTAEGGALCIHVPGFDADDLHRWFTLMSLFGQSKDALTKQSGGSWEYDIVADGYKCNMPDVLAAMGLVELARYETDTMPRRRHITSLYAALLGDIERFELPLFMDDRRVSSHHLFPLRVKGIDEAHRKLIIDRAHANGVDLNVHFKPLPILSYYKSLGYRAEDFPVAMDSYAREISLPVYYDLTDEMVARVVDVITTAV